VLKDSEIGVIFCMLFISPLLLCLFCKICNRQRNNKKNNNEMRAIKIKPIDYEVFIDEHIEELNKTNEIILGEKV